MKLKAELLESSTGARYLGCHVMRFVVNPYLRILVQRIGQPKAVKLMLNRRKRDGPLHHVTILAPGEVQNNILLKVQKIWFDFHIVGLGRAFDGESEAAFIALASTRATKLREMLGLPVRDFHITLGFDPKDIHHKHKDRSSLIYTSKQEKSTRKFDKLMEKYDTTGDVY